MKNNDNREMYRYIIKYTAKGIGGKANSISKWAYTMMEARNWFKQYYKHLQLISISTDENYRPGGKRK